MFDDKNIELDQVVEARKQKIADSDAWEILGNAEKLIVGRGKKILIFDPRQDDQAEIMKVCLGRTGNLRAPTLKIGNKVVVGYNDEMYEQYVA